MVRRRGEVIWNPVDGQVVGLDLQTSRYFSLNHSATTLWELLEQDVSADDLAHTLMRDHHLDEATARRDVEAFLAELSDNGLLEG